MNKKLPPIKIIKIDDLQPYNQNARLHSESQIEQIAANIKENGFLVPIVIGKKNIIAAGHGRLEALKRLGYTEVSCVDASHLSEKQRRAYAIADNKIASNSEDDVDLLTLELTDLHDLGVDILELGIGKDELAKLLPDLIDPAVDEVKDPNLRVSFTVVCDSIEQLQEMTTKLNLSKPKISHDEFWEAINSEGFNP